MRGKLPLLMWASDGAVAWLC